ncbi:MAG: glutathione binding-like protein [Microcoleaceae cyanobacterium]
MTNNLAPSYSRTKLETSINQLLPVFEQKLAESKYLLGGEEWTMADVAALCSFGYYSLRLNEDWLLQYDNLRDWFNRLHEIESVKSTVPMPLN